MTHRHLLEAHEALLPELQQAGEGLVRVLSAAIDAHSLKVHKVSMRVKAVSSLAGKLERPDKIYRDLWDVTDLVALRVITYFDDHVHTIGRLIERHLTVDYENSVDKRQDLDDEQRFGYRSVHYICHLPGFEGAVQPRFEIQIRTILEHAWAEIEHDLGYKAHDVMPVPTRRRLMRLAGMLELADQEFLAIREQLTTYDQDLPDRLAAEEDIPLDLITLKGLLALPECEDLDQAVAAVLAQPLTDRPFFPDYLLGMLRVAGYDRLSEIRAHLLAEREAIERLATPYFDFARKAWRLTPEPMRGYGLLLLAHWRVLSDAELDLERVHRLTDFYHRLDYPKDEREAQRVASQLFETFRDHGVLPG